MNRIALATGFAALLLFPAVRTAHAGASAFVGSTEISALSGAIWLDDIFIPSDEDPRFSRVPTISLDGGFLWGFRLGHRFTRRIEAEASLGYASGSVQADFASEEPDGELTGLTTVVYNINALYYLTFFGESFEPYVAAGAGGTSYRPASHRVLDGTASLTGNAGGGARYYLSDKLALRGDARVYVSAFDRNQFMRLYPNFAPQVDDKTLTHYEVSLGLTLRFFDTDLF
jgi:hypothetical protein